MFDVTIMKGQHMFTELLPPDRTLTKYKAAFHSDLQREVYEAYCVTGSVNGTSRLLAAENPGDSSRDVGSLSKVLRAIQYKAYKMGWRPKELPVVVDKKVSTRNVKAIERNLKKKIATFVITWAQNATPVHKNFLKSLKAYCEHKNALLLVIAGRYKNPTSQFTAKQQDGEYWAEDISEYLIDGRIDLNQNMIVMGDIKTQPTAENPLSGFKSITQDKSGVFGHSKIAMESVATPQNALPKLLVTTGAITLKNYTDSKAGAKGEFHHTFGATVIEIQGDLFHMRQINACTDGSFIDLEHEYTPRGHKKAGRPLGLILGDLHTQFIDPDSERSVFGKGGMVEVLNPRAIVFHDLYDGYSGSHWHKDRLFINYAKHHSGMNNVEGEVRRTLAKVGEWVKKGIEYYVVDSNHNQHLVIWLQNVNPKTDYENTQFWCKIMSKMLAETVMGKTSAEYPNPLQMLADEQLGLKNLHWLTETDKLVIADIECGLHGHKGANGARGSLQAFSTIGQKNITGHGHSPGIKHGHYRVGTNSRLDLEYAQGGLSSWLHTDCLIYANGKRTLIHKFNGQWRAVRARGKRNV